MRAGFTRMHGSYTTTAKGLKHHGHHDASSTLGDLLLHYHSAGERMAAEFAAREAQASKVSEVKKRIARRSAYMDEVSQVWVCLQSHHAQNGDATCISIPASQPPTSRRVDVCSLPLASLIPTRNIDLAMPLDTALYILVLIYEHLQ